MKLLLLFGGLLVACIVGFLAIWMLIISNPQLALGLQFLLMPFGWGIIIFGVGTVICFIIKK